MPATDDENQQQPDPSGAEAEGLNRAERRAARRGRSLDVPSGEHPGQARGGRPHGPVVNQRRYANRRTGS